MQDLFKSYKSYIILVLAVALLLNIIVSIKLTTQYGGADLRARIVGARLLNDGRSPYFYKWQPGEDQKLLDPNINLNRKVNGNVVTPAYLILVQSLSYLPYNMIRICWTILQYLFIGLLIILMLQYLPAPKQGINWMMIITCVSFMCTDIWIYNIERGQTYTLYTFLVGYIILAGLKPGKKGGNIAGFINGMIIFLRPSFVVLMIPFLIRRDYKFCLMFSLGFIAGLLIFVFPFYSIWIDYFNAMQEYGNEIINGVASIKRIDNLPHTIENLSSLQNIKEIKVAGILTVQDYLEKLGIILNSTTSMVACGMVLLLYLVFFIKKKLFYSNIKTILFAFVAYITVEYFFIGARGSYAVIQWFLPVYLLLLNRFSFTRFVIIVFAFTQILMMPAFNFQYGMQIQGLIGEGSLYFLCLYDIFINKSIANDGVLFPKIKTG